MKLTVLVLLLMPLILCTMEHSADSIQKCDEKEKAWKVWETQYKILSDPKNRDWTNKIARWNLNESIKNYLLAKMLTQENATYKHCRMRQGWEQCWISPDKKKAFLLYYGEDDASESWFGALFGLPCYSTKLVLYDFETDQVTAFWKEINPPTIFRNIFKLDVHWSADSSKIVLVFCHTKSSNIEIYLFDVCAGKKIDINFPILQSSLWASTWHPVSGNILVLTCDNNHLMMFDPLTGQMIKEYDLHKAIGRQFTEVYCIAHPRRNLIFIARNYKSIVIDLEDGALCYETEGPVSKASWSDDGTKLALLGGGKSLNIIDLSKDSTIRVFDIRTATRIETLTSDFVLYMRWASPMHIYIIMSKNYRYWEPEKICCYKIGIFNIETGTCTYTEDMSYNRVREIMQYEFTYASTVWDWFSRINFNYVPHDRYVHRFYTIDRFNALKTFLNTDRPSGDDEITSALSFKQMLLLNAIDDSNKRDAFGACNGEKYALDPASYEVFKSLPRPVQVALKPLVIKYSRAYYAAADACDLVNPAINSLVRLTL